MSIDKSREQFEAWAVTTGFEPHHFAVRGDGEYQVYDVRRLWGPWQASRAAIEVEFPPEWGAVSEKDEGANEMRNHCVSAIESLGLKVKA